MMMLRELDEYLKIPEKTLYRIAVKGKVLGFKVGASWHFCNCEIDKWTVKQKTLKK